MAEHDYYFPRPTSGGYRWHIQQKVQIAIGRKLRAMCNVGEDQIMIRFDPPLDPSTELPLIEAIFADPAQTTEAPVIGMVNQVYMMKDIYYSSFRDDLAAELGCEVHLWFPKSSPELPNSDRIAIHCSKLLTVQDKKKVQDAVDALMIGWV